MQKRCEVHIPGRQIEAEYYRLYRAAAFVLIRRGSFGTAPHECVRATYSYPDNNGSIYYDNNNIPLWLIAVWLRSADIVYTDNNNIQYNIVIIYYRATVMIKIHRSYRRRENCSSCTRPAAAAIKLQLVFNLYYYTH